MPRLDNIKIILRDLLHRRATSLAANSAYIDMAASWLARAQNATNDDGVSAAYSMLRGWYPSYLETTGYIVPTMFDYASYSGKDEYRDRAVRMANWLVGLQLRNGAFQGGTVAHNPVPRVFNTGQVMIGLLRTYRETSDERFLESLRQAADWLVSVQNKDGSWSRFNLEPAVPAYNARVAWPLAELGLLIDKQSYVQAARRFLEWAASRQIPNGWFAASEVNALRGGLTHFLAYVASGFLESGCLLGDSSYIQTAKRFCDAILDVFIQGEQLAATYDRDWRACCGFSCLTGNAQISILWQQLHRLFGDDRYLAAALAMNRSLKSEVDLGTSDERIRGALKGSSPIWARYLRFAYPNWATKFLLDALLMEERLLEARDRRVCEPRSRA